MNKKLKVAWEKRKKLYTEGDKLWAEGAKLWAEAVLEVYGNIKMEWKNGECPISAKSILAPRKDEQLGNAWKVLKRFRKVVNISPPCCS